MCRIVSKVGKDHVIFGLWEKYSTSSNAVGNHCNAIRMSTYLQSAEFTVAWKFQS